MRSVMTAGAVLILSFLISFFANAQDPDTPSCTLQMRVDSAIGPATDDYFAKAIAQAKADACKSILLLLDTPGGNLQSTRHIVEKIVSSEIPFLCLVSPSGGRAASAGAIILMACHVAGAEAGTNLGAAMPVLMGESLPDDIKSKVVQDTVAWVVSLAKLRGRNVDYATKMVTEAQSVDAQTALANGAIDFVAGDVDQFLKFAETKNVAVGALTSHEADLRNRVLQFLTDPELAYILFMASIGLLIFEITHAGAIVPGVTGAIGLILSLIAFHKLDVEWGSVALIVLGIVLLIAEMFVTSFGALGIGGLVALAAGSFFLYDPVVLGQRLPISMIVVTVVVLSLVALGVGYLMLKTLQLGKSKPERALIGKKGEVKSLESPSLRRGMVFVEGEFWQFLSEQDLSVGSRVEVIAQEGLRVQVREVFETSLEGGRS